MNSSASSAPRSTHEHEMCLALDDNTTEKGRIDEVAIILSFLPRKDIMRARQVCTTWRDAAMKTIVPLCEFRVDSVRAYNAMRAMSTSLPNLQQISICNINASNGEDPDDINIISIFRNLRSLDIWRHASLNGRYPVLFNFPLLEKLSVSDCRYLKWDLEMLQGLTSLKELDCTRSLLTGNLSSLGALKDSLEKVRLCS
eukprot:scaffold37414_cov255-Skeletonema_dohrnii-CCMP3373.AAC.2